MTTRKIILTLLSSLLLLGCTGKPKLVKPVSAFELNRYLGTWYEIARLDHSFERGLNQITAEYSLNEDGSVKVVNRGWKEEEGQWSEALGKAKFVGDSEKGHLKVSFFGPFYGSYIIFHLEPDYSTALISGPNLDYFWILSRTPTLEDEELERLKKIASQVGFDTNSLLYPNHKSM